MMCTYRQVCWSAAYTSISCWLETLPPAQLARCQAVHCSLSAAPSYRQTNSTHFAEKLHSRHAQDGHLVTIFKQPVTKFECIE
jgi:hypothetical protein